MKQTIPALLIILTMSLSAAADPGIDAFDQNQVEASFQDVEAAPAALNCDGVALTQLNSLEPQFQRAFASAPEAELTVSVRVNDERTHLLYDSIEGDQIESLLFSKKDLAALAAGLVDSVVGHKYTGFWWRDGKHLEVSTVSCVLAPSK